MKKLLLSALAMSALISTSSAQIFFEDFNSGIPGTFTLHNVDGNTPNTNVSALTDAWNALTLDNRDAALSTSWYTPAGTADDWMVTPAIAIPNTTNDIALEWLAQAPDASFADGLEVYVSTTGTSVGDFSGPALYNTTAAGEAQTWTLRSVNLNANKGQTVYIAFRNNSNDDYLLGVDDITVREVFPNDLEMTALTVSKYGTGGNINITGTITNRGSNSVNSYDIVYTANGGTPVVASMTNTIAPGATYNFSHSTPLTTVAGTLYDLVVYTDLSGDGNNLNDTLIGSHTALTSVPTKINVGEEKTGTWCGWCPRGAVGLAVMEAQSDFIGIAVHNNDPMVVSAYDGNIGTYIPGGYPGGGVDRVLEGDPNGSSFLAMHNQRKSAVVPCDVKNIVATVNGGNISISADAEFYGTVKGDYRLSCVIVEDDVASSNQTNYYGSGGSGGPGGANDNGGPMAFPAGINNGFDFYGAATSVPSSSFLGYDHVARSLSSNNILGTPASLPAGTVTTGVHSFTFPNVPTSTVNNINKAHAVVMVIDASTGEILNANKGNIGSVSVNDIDTDNFELDIFPNPTKDITNITFNLTSNENVLLEVYNATGSIVYTENAGVLSSGNHKLTFNGNELNSGFYFINLTIGDKVVSKKVSLLK